LDSQGAGASKTKTGFVLMPCRALEAFGPHHRRWGVATTSHRLNALSGIGGVWTQPRSQGARASKTVLMPCRALEAFGRYDNRTDDGGRQIWVLMPCRALEAFGPSALGFYQDRFDES